MQPNSITLAVDTGNTGTTTDLELERFEEFQNRTVYVSDQHTVGARESMTLYRTFPKASGNFRGTQKSCVKFTLDVVVSGVDGTTELTAPIIMECTFSIPVGATTADVLEMRQRIVALTDLDSVMNPLNNQLMI